MNGARILIVEDDPFEAENLRLNLTQQGYRVIAIVSSGEDCLELIRNEEVDLVIIDIILSGDMDGIDTADMIHRFYHLPFIFLTAFDSADWIERAEHTHPVAYLLKPYHVKELYFLIRIGLERWRLERKLKQEKDQAEANLWRLATHDPLTQLPNRDLLINRLERAIRKAHRASEKMALMFIDLDHFKEINDSFGHFFGDQVIQAVARHLEEHTREDDTIARFGGDEFTVIIEQFTDVQNLGVLAQKLIDSFSKPFRIGKLDFRLSASIGISLFPDDGESPETLLRNADAAMYRAKADGRNSFQFYTPDLTEKALQRVHLEVDLRAAIEQKQFVLYYQPQIDMQTRQIVGVEALIRWRHPEKGLIQPLNFIPTAEKTGQIYEIGQWVLETACNNLVEWRRQGYSLAKIAINISQRQFSRASFMDMLRKILHNSGCDPQSLELEITESLLLAKSDIIAAGLEELRDLGLSISIDDFGTGYSSLSYLKKFPINKLKIDRSFIKDIPQDLNDKAISRAIIAMGKSLDLDIIAEGVETQEQKEFLLKEGCRIGQGFLFSKPMPENEFLKFISEQPSSEDL